MLVPKAGFSPPFPQGNFGSSVDGSTIQPGVLPPILIGQQAAFKIS